MKYIFLGGIRKAKGHSFYLNLSDKIGKFSLNMVSLMQVFQFHIKCTKWTMTFYQTTLFDITGRPNVSSVKLRAVTLHVWSGIKLWLLTFVSIRPKRVIFYLTVGEIIMLIKNPLIKIVLLGNSYSPTLRSSPY